MSGPLRLDSTGPDFSEAFAALIRGRREAAADVAADVRAILRQVRDEGDAALAALTARFDGLEGPVSTLRVSAETVDAAVAGCPADQLQALRLAANRIRAFHERMVPQGSAWMDLQGVHQGMRWTPVDAAGIYVPGGTAAYPSSVLMNAIPARVAGVTRIAMAVPAPGGVLSPLVLVAAKIAAVDEIWRIGGAQAIAALAFGTETIRPVDVITGPGNAWVAEAKRQVYGRVGIDMIAGPSEVVIVADEQTPAAWLAADLMAQAEHDPAAQSVLITDSRAQADAVVAEVDALLQRLSRARTARASWQAHGAVVTVASHDETPALVDALAPEHLQLAIRQPEAMAGRIRHAGAIFLGRWTPEVIGDYVGGPNHVLPTSRTARFASGLSVQDFMKRTTLLGCEPAGFTVLAEAAEILARAEGLDAHAEAIAVRRRQSPG